MSNATNESPRSLTTSDVRHDLRGSLRGRWIVELDGHEAEMTYTRVSSDVVVIDHTGVPTALRDHGLGQLLVERAVDDARREGFKINPHCSFAKAQFQRHPDWADVLTAEAEADRAQE